MLGIGERHELPTVLLIDDDHISREVIATVLTLHGYTVHTVSDGAASLAMLDAGQCAPQLILMDAQMTGLSGTQLIQELRHRCRASIYAISGSDIPGDLKAAADGFLLKPFGPEALQALVAKNSLPPKVQEPVLPVIQLETLAQFRQIMPEPMVREIYTAVAADLLKRSAALEAAIARSDAAEVRRIGHAIKGGCSMAGAAQVAQLGARIEAESDQLDNSASLLRELASASLDLQRMLEEEFPV